MPQTNEHPNPETAVLAVSRSPDRAGGLSEALRRAGLCALPCTDLETALAGGAPLLFVDPVGWEESCQASLASFSRRRSCPPAVLFVSPAPHVPYTAGPAFAFLPEPVSGGDLAAASTRALKARERFCAYWPGPLAAPGSRELQKVAAVLEGATGLEVRPDRLEAFSQAVRTRMVARLVPSLREYADALTRRGEGAAEVEILSGLLTVGETYFWRYAGQFRALQAMLLPSLAGLRGGSRRLRLWSAGCATGEEAWSLAMACAEALEPGIDWEIVATDIHRPSLARAEAGEYRSRSLRNLPHDLVRRFTEPISGGARVQAALRRRVRFEFLNLGSDGLAAWARERGPFDAIFCRNTLIYFSRPAAGRVIDVFQRALAEGGGLFLGASEALHPPPEGLRVVRGLGSFYYVKEPRGEPTGEVGSAAAPGEAVAAATSAALHARAVARLEAEDSQGAREAFRALVAQYPEDSRGHAGLALLLADEGCEAEARRHLDRARRRRPELAETHYLLGLLEERAGREAEALLHYGQALAVDSGFFMAHFNRAWILRRLGRTEACLEELLRVRELLGRTPPAAAWITGGLGLDAVADLVGRGLEDLGVEAER